jgi:hypothetical protein
VARRKRRAIATTALSPSRPFEEAEPPFMHSALAHTLGDPPQTAIALSETLGACIVVEETPGCAVEEEIPNCITGEQEHPPIAIALGDPPQPPIAPIEVYATCIVEEETPDCDTAEQEHKTSPGNTNAGLELEREEPELERNLPPLLHPDHLKLIFEMRSLMDDQAFRTMGIHQRLDMLYAAYSEAIPRRQCPTCARPFALPGNAASSTN